MRTWIPFIILLLFWFVILGKVFKLPLQGWQWLTMLSGWFYTLAIFYLCLTPTSYNWGGPKKVFYYFHGVPVNLIPFQAFSPDFFMNVVMTIPAGVYAYLLITRKSFPRILLLGVLLGLGIESSQFICDVFFHVERFVDIDDVITNATGVVVGFYLMKSLTWTPINHWIQQLSLNFAKL